MVLEALKSLFRSRSEPANPYEVETPVFENRGFCPTCQQEVRFAAENEWFRDFYFCTNCGSIPRERALMWVTDEYYPEWKELVVHESSPGGRGASARLARECRHYMPSQFFHDCEPGAEVHGVRCENLEAMSFVDESVDLHISQDVMEHVFSPKAVFREIARTLRPGGAHVFTVPIVNKDKPSRLRARLRDDGDVVHLQAPEFHGNPIDDAGSLVTVDWGYDICGHIFEACGLFTHLVHIDDLSKGIRAEYIEVLVTVKPHPDAEVDPIP